MFHVLVPCVALLFAIQCTCIGDTDTNDEISPLMAVHLLSYIASDYGLSVKDGKVISKAEYQEQLDFFTIIAAAVKADTSLRSHPQFLNDVSKLSDMIRGKADPTVVSTQCQIIRDTIIKTSRIAVSPLQWPNRLKGKEVYITHCAQCHGVTGLGDGLAGKGLRPPPTNFFDDKMASVSPFQAYNTIRLGVPGTGMASFAILSDSDIWNLAFYVISMRHEEKQKEGKQTSANDNGNSMLALHEVATLSDEMLLKHSDGAALTLARTFAPEPLGTKAYLEVVRSRLNVAVVEFRSQNYSKAKEHVVAGYLEGIEPVEPRISANNPELTQLVEENFSHLREIIGRRDQKNVFEEKVQEIFRTLKLIEDVLEQRKLSPAITFTASAGIFLREAFEAVLIIVTLLAVSRSLSLAAASIVIHLGWIVGVIAGVIGWFFSGWLMAISGAGREILEGVISALAVVVLLYLGFWLHRRAEISRWRAFIDDMVKGAKGNKKLLALGVVSFMAVFREAFETVLFLRALLLEAGEHQQWVVGAGVLSSFVVALVAAAFIVKFSVNVPMRYLFSVSSWILVFLSVTLLGHAMHSFQESGVLSVTAFPVRFRFDLLGIYPTYETLIPQLVLIVLCVVLYRSQSFDISSG